MPDPGWLFDIIKVVGGGAIGVAGKTLTDRTKRRQMRRHLYKEMMYNYDTLWDWVSSVRNYEQEFGDVGTYPFYGRVHTEYYQHASKDLDTFNSLAESYTISSLYRDVESFMEDAGSPESVGNADHVCRMLEASIHSGHLDRKLATKVHLPDTRAEFEERLELYHSRQRPGCSH